MKRTWLRAVLCAAMAAVLAGCGDATSPTDASRTDDGSKGAAVTSEAPSAQINGTATYRERMALPPNASFEATLEDVSRADAPATVLSRAQIEPAGQPPFRFTLQYDPVQLEAGHNYAIRAKVTHEGRLMFTSDQHYAIPTEGEELSIMMVRAHGAEQSASATGIENVQWNLVRLGDQAVKASSAERQPNLTLSSADNRVSGYGGCNRMLGTYSLSGEQLTFSQLAGTMMACADGMEHERAFHDALGKVARWRLQGEQLELRGAAGESLAVFERRRE